MEMLFMDDFCFFQSRIKGESSLDDERLRMADAFYTYSLRGSLHPHCIDCFVESDDTVDEFLEFNYL